MCFQVTTNLKREARVIEIESNSIHNWIMIQFYVLLIASCFIHVRA